MMAFVRLTRYLSSWFALRWAIYQCKWAKVMGRQSVTFEYLPRNPRRFYERLAKVGFDQPKYSSGANGSSWTAYARH